MGEDVKGDEKLRILICVQEYYPDKGGIAKVAYDVVQGLKENGQICTVLSPSGPDIKVGGKNLIKRFGGLGLILFWRKVHNFIKKNYASYDIIWLHQPIFLKKLKNKNILITVHTTSKGYNKDIDNLDCSFFLKKYYKLMETIENRSYNRFKDIIFSGVSKEVISELLEIGVPKKNLIYISNGVYTSKFMKKKSDFREKIGIPSDYKIMVSVGRLTHQKQPLLLLDFFKKLQRVYPKIFLIFIGIGELKEQLESKIINDNIKNVKLLGFIENEKLPEILSASDFFVMSSRYEGQPLSLFEAMSCGLYPILSKIPVLTEIREESDIGINIDFSKEEEISKVKLLMEEELTEQKKNARKFVIKNYDWNSINDKYYLLMKEIINKNA